MERNDETRDETTTTNEGVIDLDAARAARREAQGEAPTVVFGGETFVLPPELPYTALEALRGMADTETAPGAMVDLTRALLGDGYERFTALDPSMEDVTELVGGAMNEYGVKRPLPSSAS